MSRYATTALLALLVASGVGGCVERTMVIDSNPPGALVYFNDQEIGRTPFQRDFNPYGKYDTQIRADGFETLKTTTQVNPPIYEWIPIDLFAEILPIPFHDTQHFTYTLKPTPPEPDETALIAQAIALRGELVSSHYTTTRPATTRPAKRPATNSASTRPASN